jgi:2-dehydropantoate 2-reductase
MNVCIVGAGAIGGLLGTRLATADEGRVSALAHGATLAALRAHGWRLRMGGALRSAPATASDDARELGAQDGVVLALKAPALPALAPSLAPLLGPDTVVLSVMNGVPWWFCHGVPGIGDTPLDSIDPGGRTASALPWSHVLGGVVHIAASRAEPGLSEHRAGNGVVVGEPAGGLSARAAQVADRLTRAGFDVTHSADVRHDIWYKLWGNLVINPITALTGATSDRVLADPLVRGFASAAMVEAAAIGERIGCRIAQTPEDRHAMTAKLGPFRSSMLQDAEAGRALELDAIVGAVRELGMRTGVPTPSIDALLGLTRLFGRVHGLYPDS